MTARILIIDDEPLLASLFAQAFADDGYDADIALDGRSGLRLLEQEHHALIVTDLNMPEFDGLETIRGIRRLGLDTKVVAVSAGGLFDPNMLLKLACSMGADAGLAKPFALDRLVSLGVDLMNDIAVH